MSLDELTRDAIDRIKNYKGDKIRIMEVCGTHTHEIFKSGIRGILPPNIELISGPGCPVCVTPVSYIDEAIWLATEKRITVFTFGDLIRVPGEPGFGSFERSVCQSSVFPVRCREHCKRKSQ